jgi:hypothetical protein
MAGCERALTNGAVDGHAPLHPIERVGAPERDRLTAAFSFQDSCQYGPWRCSGSAQRQLGFLQHV